MLRAYQMPVRTDLATRVGPRLWRKTVLRSGRISKDGVTIDVDRDRLAAYAASFNAGALDRVPFVLVDDRNRHVDDPERYRGHITGMELSPDGTRLDALIETTPEGSALIEANPHLGVSPRLVERLDRADGRRLGPTIVHVAGTLDPEIAGMGGWSPVDLASGARVEIVDLTRPDPPAEDAPPAAAPGGDTPAPPAPAGGADTPAPPGGPNPTPQETAMTAPLTEDELARLRALLDRATTPPDAQPDGAPAPELSDADLDALAAAVLDDTPEQPEQPGDTTPADQSDRELVNAAADRDLAAELDLANARAETQALELARLRAENDRRAYETERDTLARDFGIPPRIVDLARPLLEGSGRTVDLAAGQTADAGQIVRNLLRELGRTYKALDLSGPLGTAHDTADADAERADRDQFIEQARAAGFAR